MTTRAVSLTDKQQRFAELFVLDPEVSGHQTNSAIKAGYSAKSAAVAASRLLRHPAVRAEIERINRELLGDYATASIRYLGKLVNDQTANQKLRLEAAKTLLDRGGYIAPRAPSAPEIREKEIEAMSIAELQAFIKEGKEQVEREKQAIDVTPAAVEAAPTVARSDW